MATGLEALDTLKERTAKYPINSYATVSSIEALDLRKLSAQDLISRDYDAKFAGEISKALSL